MSHNLVLGGDLGGTSTRLVLATAGEEAVARVKGPGGNPLSHPQTAVATLSAALEEVLVDVDPTSVEAGVLGMAGGTALEVNEIRGAYDAAWRAAGLRCPLTVRSDLEIAYAAGTSADDGAVLVAGTGSAAAEIRGGRQIRTVGGHGWLLGDEGAGFWLGREAARATLRALDAGEPPGPLALSVGEHLGVPVLRDRLVNAIAGAPPLRLAELAALVPSAYASGDPAARRIVDSAVEHLCDLIDRLRASAGSPLGSHLVLAGSVVGRDTPVGAELRQVLGTVGWVVGDASEPVWGAVRLARRALDDHR